MKNVSKSQLAGALLPAPLIPGSTFGRAARHASCAFAICVRLAANSRGRKVLFMPYPFNARRPN